MWTEEQNLFRESLRRFVEEEIDPNADAWEAAGGFPVHDVLSKMGDLGFLGVNYPEAYGGAGLDFWFNVIRAEELGRASSGGVAVALTVHTDMCTPALAEHGSHELKARFLEPAIRGRALGAVAVTEPAAGSDVAGLRARADSDGDHYVVTGTKTYVTNGARADWVCALVRTSPGAGPDGMSLVIVPTDTPGFTVSKEFHKLGNHSSDTAELYFDGVRVPKAFRIGPEGQGFKLQMGQFQKERLIASVCAYAAAERILRLTIDYTRQRMAFGRPVVENQWVHFHLAELATEIEMLRQMCYHCTRRLVAGEAITREASMAKLKAGRLARQVADACLQFHGGLGYMEEYPLARYFRDARLVSIGGGTDEIMLGIIAKLEGIYSGRRDGRG